MKKDIHISIRRFLFAYRYRFLVVTLLFMYSCDLLDDEVTSSRQAFIGSFEMIQNCDNNARDRYTLRITAGSSSNEVLLTGIEPFGDEIIATVTGNVLTIASQSIRLRGQTSSVNVSGSGTLTDGTSLDITFRYNFGGSVSCTTGGAKL
ncbi:MAG: hypothetical protein MUD08_06825 [Cytophagales bacterium]|jgi:hypothetical protein|nr:hypothetical protein [Cytophagales bacterium]